MIVITAAEIQTKLKRLGNRDVAAVSQRFFKTGPGEYGEGDLFRGIRVPALKTIAREYQKLSLAETFRLLHSTYHEERLVALLILVRSFANGDDTTKAKIYRLYLKHTRFINSWDLVDSSAPQIVGGFLWDKDRKLLYSLARSQSLWERRIAVLATFHFIKHGEFAETLKIARMLLTDRHDLIHKAVGWMLREVGKRDQTVAENFLRNRCRRMPRTMLRYAIERFPESKRRQYLSGNI